MDKFSSLDDLFNIVIDIITNYRETKFVLDKSDLNYYELLYTTSGTIDDIVSVLDIDIKDFDTSVNASDEYIEIYGKDDSKAELVLLQKLKDNASELIVYQQVILLASLEDIMKIQ
jgi:HJR/Mrr/RecB family endonuclease